MHLQHSTAGQAKEQCYWKGQAEARSLSLHLWKLPRADALWVLSAFVRCWAIALLFQAVLSTARTLETLQPTQVSNSGLVVHRLIAACASVM